MTTENKQKDNKNDIDLDNIQDEERKYWKGYEEIMISKYRDAFLNLPYYQEEFNLVKNLINPQKGQKWLDLGCGSLPVAELILEKSKGEVEIIAGDIHLEPAKKRLSELGNPSCIKLQYIDLSKKLPFPDNYFDGITAITVLTYVPQFEGVKGKEALKNLLQEIYRILKPNGTLLWSTPKKGVNQLVGAFQGATYFLNPYQWIKQKCFLPFLAIKLLNFFKFIDEKEKTGFYHLYSQEEYEELLFNLGFKNSEWYTTCKGMVLLNKIEKL